MPANKRGRFSFERKHWVILFCLIGLLAFALAYLFIYIPANEKHLNERRFNAMRRIETNIDAKQTNTFRLIESLTKALALSKDSMNRKVLENYIDSAFSAEQPLVFNQLIRKKNTDSLKKELSVTKRFVVTKTTYEEGNIQFSGKLDYHDSTVNVLMNYTVEKFFEPLLSGAGFDEFVVLINGKVIFETFPSGLKASELDSVPKTNKNLVGANSRQLTIAGVDYQAFIQPFALGQEDQRSLIMGLVHYEKFQSERVQLPAKQVMIFIISGILILVLLPWLKLFNMGSKDRLTLWDGAASFIVSMLLVSITFMGFAWLAVRYQPHNHLLGLENIADSIESKNAGYFIRIKLILDSLDSLVCADENLRTNIVKLDSVKHMKRGTQYLSDPKYNKELSDTQRLQIHAIIKKTQVFQVFWLNKKNGNELFNWSIDSFNAPSGNYSKRNYFKKLQNQANSYSADQVISWTSGLFRSIIAKNSKDSSKIACISFPLKPVEKPILPVGYSFAITDKNGEVLYHTNESHNLNENFPEETADPEAIKAAISSHAAVHMEARYKGTDSRLFIRPVSFDGIPYWVIITYDKRFESAIDTGAFSFTLSMTLVFFLIVFVQMVLVVFISARKSRLNASRMETDWIWPRPSLHKIYQYASIYHVFIFFLLILIYYNTNFLSFLFNLMLALSTVTLFINYLYLKKYETEKRITTARYKKRNIAVLISLQIVINLIALWHLRDDSWNLVWILLFQISGFILASFLISRYNDEFKNNDAGVENKQDVNRGVFIASYARLAITRLLISSGLPVFFFYQYAYNHQQSIQAHSRQITYAWDVFDKVDNTNAVSAFDEFNHYKDNYWIKKIDSGRPSIPPNTFTHADSISADLLNRFRIYATEVSRKTGAFSHPNIQDSAYSFFPVTGTFSRDTGFSTLVRFNHHTSAYLTSEKISFLYPNIIPVDIPIILYWLLFLVSILILYFTIKRVIKQIFSLDVPGEKFPQPLAEKIIQFSTGSKLTYISGLPGTRKMHLVRASTSSTDRIIIDLFKFPSAQFIWKYAKTVVFNHFEYLLHNKDACKHFLILLESMLVSNEKPAIIIVSTVHAERAIGIISRMLHEENSVSNEPVKERFQILLGHFNSIILSILPWEIDGLEAMGKKHQENWMNDEFIISPFIERLRLPLKEVYEKVQGDDKNKETTNKKRWMIEHWRNELLSWFDDSRTQTGERVIWNLQNIAVIFYQHIWQSLSPEERYLVYDLAEEGLVNQSDKYHLSMLIQKGLVKRKEPNGQLELMNDSFRNFVLVSVNKAEALQLKNELKAESSWSDLRTPITLVIVGILAILLASQQQAFSTIIGYLTAIAAIIPTLNAIFSLIKPAGQGKV